MSAVVDKATVRRLVEEAQSGGDIDVVDELLAEDFVDHSAYPGLSPDREGAKQFFGALHAAFDDFHAVIHQQVAEGDEVACRFTLRAVHEGEFNGIPPTGRQVELKGITILRFAKGRCIERWSQADFMGMLEQLGVVPAP